MSPQPSPFPQNLPGARKAAIFLMGIGDQIGADLIRQLAPDEIRRISNEITAMSSVQPEHMLNIFREFESLTATSRFFAKGGFDRAKKLLEQAVGPDSALALMKDAPPPPPEIRDESEPGPLHNTDPKELAKVLREENPQTLALILSNLPPEQAGPLMASLPPEVQPQVALRIALMDRISPDVFRRIADAIRTRLKAAKQLSRSNGTRALASILNYVDGETTERVLSALEPENRDGRGLGTRSDVRVRRHTDHRQRGDQGSAGEGGPQDSDPCAQGHGREDCAAISHSACPRAAPKCSEKIWKRSGPCAFATLPAAQQQVVTVVRQLQKDGSIAARSGGAAGAAATNMSSRVLTSPPPGYESLPWRQPGSRYRVTSARSAAVRLPSEVRQLRAKIEELEAAVGTEIARGL